MKRILFLFLSLSVAAMIGCNSKTESKSGDGANSAVSDAESAPLDFSTPTAAVETMIAAAVAKDVDTLAKCFAAGALGGDRDREAMLEWGNSPGRVFISGGTVTGETISDDGTQAKVEAKSRRSAGLEAERIFLTKTDAGWKVVQIDERMKPPPPADDDARASGA